MTKRPSRKRERDELVTGLREQGKTWVEIANVLRERYGYHTRAAMRLAHGWSQTRAAEEWSKRWPDDIKTGKNFSYWETWPESGYPPSLSTLDRLAFLYQCGIADLLSDAANYSHLDTCAPRQPPRSRSTEDADDKKAKQRTKGPNRHRADVGRQPP